MIRFERIENGMAIIKKRNVYCEAWLYRRGDDVYVGVGGGYARVYAHGNTSVPTIKWIELQGATVNGETVSPGQGDGSEQ